MEIEVGMGGRSRIDMTLGIELGFSDCQAIALSYALLNINNTIIYIPSLSHLFSSTFFRT